MHRISVVGTSCSGKTTIARNISALYGIPHIELDTIFWQPNWTSLPLDQYRRAVKASAAGNEWIIDGNYSRVRDIVWGRATDVVWMNIPLATILWRVIKRTTQRVVTQEELFAGNRETVQNALLSKDALIWWIIRTHHGRIKALREALDSEQFSHLRVHEIRRANGAVSLLGFDQIAG